MDRIFFLQSKHNLSPFKELWETAPFARVAWLIKKAQLAQVLQNQNIPFVICMKFFTATGYCLVVILSRIINNFRIFFSMKSIFVFTNKPISYWLLVTLCASNYNKPFFIVLCASRKHVNIHVGVVFFSARWSCSFPNICLECPPLVLWAKASALWNVLTWGAVGTTQERICQESKVGDSYRHRDMLLLGMYSVCGTGPSSMSISLLFQKVHTTFYWSIIYIEKMHIHL